MKKTDKALHPIANAWGWFTAHAFLVAAAPALIIALGLAVLDRVAAGTLAAGIFVALILLHYLPQMESLTAFGVAAVWRKRLDEAEEILRKLRQTAVASARLTYHTLGRGGRMMGGQQKLKQEIADLADETLRETGVSEDEIAEIKRDYLKFAAELDLYFVFVGLVQLNVYTNNHRIRARGAMLDASDPEIEVLREKGQRLTAWRSSNNAPDDLEKTALRALCHSQIPDEDLPERDRAVLKQIANEFADVAERCVLTGRVTDEAAELISSNRSNEALRALYRLRFREDPLT